ncbi:MAG: MBL fold metallo-hydrolase, partial [Pseudohongiellaceae bacterium]
MKKGLIVVFAMFAISSSFAGPKLYIFDCGHLSFPDVGNFGITNEETDVRELFVPCYLIDHPDGKMIWDAGLPLDVVGPRQNGATSWYEESIIDQLAAIGVNSRDIDYTAYSHFHYDHVGAANEFANATLLIQETEYHAAFYDAESNPVFRPPLYSELANSTKVLLQGDHDV